MAGRNTPIRKLSCSLAGRQVIPCSVSEFQDESGEWKSVGRISAIRRECLDECYCCFREVPYPVDLEFALNCRSTGNRIALVELEACPERKWWSTLERVELRRAVSPNDIPSHRPLTIIPIELELGMLDTFRFLYTPGRCYPPIVSSQPRSTAFSFARRRNTF